MSALPTPVTHSGLRQVWGIASDLLIATALIWALPLLQGAARAVVNVLSGDEIAVWATRQLR